MANESPTSCKRVNNHFVLFCCCCFCIGFVFVLDLTKTKIFSGITYHHNKVLCKCFIHLVDVVSATVDKTIFASFEIGEEYKGTEFFKSQDDVMRCFPFS